MRGSNMTSTSFNVGLTDNTRSSSRVLRPPGGGHTDIFGGGDPEPPRGRRPAPSAFVPSPVEPVKPTNGVAEHAQNGQSAEPQPEQAQPEPVQQEPLQPEPAAEPKQEKTDSPTKPEIQAPPKVEPPKRVRVPPGGFSSGLW